MRLSTTYLPKALIRSGQGLDPCTPLTIAAGITAQPLLNGFGEFNLVIALILAGRVPGTSDILAKPMGVFIVMGLPGL
jgi:hypothetical protein